MSIEFKLEGREPMSLSVEPSVASYDPNTVSPEAAASNTSFDYSGRHDHGQLPRLNASGPYLSVVRALYEAKAKTDVLLNQVDGAATKTTQDDNVEQVGGSSDDDSDVAALNPNKKLKT